MKSEIQKCEGGAVEIVRPAPLNMPALFDAAVKLGKEGVEVIKELRALQRQEDERNAKHACDEAMRNFQRKCPAIGKTKGVPDKFGNIAYRYTPLEEIIKVIQPILDECGLSYSFDTDVQSQIGWVIAICDITHVAGHSFRKQAKFPLGTKTLIMSDTQQYSAALSFANRRVLCNALGIVTVGDDQDGQDKWRANQKGPSRKPEPKADTAPPPNESRPIPAEAAALKSTLWTMLKDVRGSGENWKDAAAWLRSHKILDEGVTVASLTAEQLQIVIEKTDLTLNPPQ